ncbi:MAG: hemerythrin domain-containing protein [Caulobacteraceae bacterium]
MATRTKTKSQRSAERKSRARSSGKDALSLLEKDHREVLGWFEQYDDAESDKEKAELAEKICLALKVHSQIEEEIFYPAVRRATKDDALVDESEVEHAGAKDLIAQIQDMSVGERLYDAKITVLGEQIKHHVHEEETEMFPEARDADLDLNELGERLASRKQELMSKLAGRGGTARSQSEESWRDKRPSA